MYQKHNSISAWLSFATHFASHAKVAACFFAIQKQPMFITALQSSGGNND